MTECHIRSLLARMRHENPRDFHKTEQDVWWIWEGAWASFLRTVRANSTVDVQGGELCVLPNYISMFPRGHKAFGL